LTSGYTTISSNKSGYIPIKKNAKGEESKGPAKDQRNLDDPRN